MEATPEPRTEDELRTAAIKAVKRKQAFRTHLLTYVLVNILLVVIWAATGADFFWPLFPILGWGIGVALDAWDAYGRRPASESEDKIQREMQRLRR